MNNYDFNLVNQLVQEQKSLWRIENHYINEARDENEKKFWESLRDDKKSHITELSEMVKKYL